MNIVLEKKKDYTVSWKGTFFAEFNVLGLIPSDAVNLNNIRFNCIVITQEQQVQGNEMQFRSN